ncbi:MAG: hypothetical protein EOO22_22965 [Comamonadaceae bacterium]|nr:MAG: hypothetical protein EOO22_22965 [Comamonadaceae bacterium]
MAAFGALLASSAHAQGEWFTVTGNPVDPTVDTVQVDPVALGIEGATKTMNVRVNRSVPRVNWDKVPYRSYESQVVFDCQARRAGYVQARYFTQPLWQGEPHVVADYADNPRPMLFRDMEPNPTSRIVRAACRVKNG